MKTYTVKELYRVIGQALKNTPFIITWHGKPKFVVKKLEEDVKKK